MTAPAWLPEVRRLTAPRPAAQQWPSPGALAQALDKATVQTPALQAIDQALVALEAGEYDRLMIFMAPQEGKSERVAKRYLEWVLNIDPELRAAIVSYADEMARRWGSDIKLDLETYDGSEGELDLGIRLRPDSKAAGRWHIAGHRGGLYCVGVGGSLTGKPVDRLVIDDPIKDLEQAQSPRYRDRARRFWQAVAVPRMGPGTKVVLIQTRWHEDDLGGWLLDNDTDGRWHVLSIPAIAESADDPLGRPVGTAMISARGDRDWAQIRADVGEYVWAALYQQRPAPQAGGLFRRDRAQTWLHAPGLDRFQLADRPAVVDLRDCYRFVTIDLAASTKTSADYTVAAAWAIAPSGDMLLLDRVRDRVEPSAHWALIAPLRARWLQPGDVVYVESRMFGTTFVYEAGQAGIPIVELHADADKWTRAIPAAARWDAGQVWLPPGVPWLDDWLSELAAFDNAAFDDQVDVFAYAARVAAAHWVPPVPAADDLALRRAAGKPGLDMMTANW